MVSFRLVLEKYTMAFLRSTFYLKNVLGIFPDRSVSFIAHTVNRNKTFIQSNVRRYSITTEPSTLALRNRLKELDEKSHKCQFISIYDATELLRIINEQKASPGDYLQAFKFFGEFMIDEAPEYRTKLARQLWQSLENQCVINIAHYNAFLGVLMENGQLLALEEIMADLNSKKLVPNQATFSKVIEYYSLQGDLDGVEKTIAMMNAKGYASNEKIYNSLILANGFGGQMNKIWDIVASMKESGIEPTFETDFNILRSHARHGDIAAILSELPSLKLNGFHLQTHHVLQLIYDLAVNGHSAVCNRLFGLLQKGSYYSRLVANTVSRLIHLNQDDVAYSLIKTLPKQLMTSHENIVEYFLDRIMKKNRPFKDVATICFRIQEDELHSNPLEIIYPKIIDPKLCNELWTIIRERKSKGLSAVEDHFRSFFVSSNETDVCETLRIMARDFDIKPTVDFLTEVVIPKLDHLSPIDIVNTLLSASVTPTHTALAVIHHCLQYNQFREAVDLMKQFNLSLRMNLYEPLLISVFKTTRDIDSYVQFLRAQYEYYEPMNDAVKVSTNVASRADAIGSILFSTLIEISPKDRVEILTNVLKGMIDQGIGISYMQAKQIENVQPSTKEISKYLEQLTSEQLNLKPIQKPNLKIHSTSKRLENRAAVKLPVNKFELLSSYRRENENNKFEELLEQLESEKADISPKIYEHLIQIKLKEKNLDKVFDIYDKCKARKSDFYLYQETIIQIVSLFIDYGRVDEAVQFLEKTKRNNNMHFGASEPQFKLLNRLAEEGRATEVCKIFNSLIENRHIPINGKLVSPLVKVHLVNENIAKAIDTFEQYATNYKFTPYKNELYIRLISRKDWTNLERVQAVAEKIHGKGNSLIDLAFRLIECNEIERAKQIFEEPSLHISSQKIDNWYRSITAQNSSDSASAINCLRALLKVTENCPTKINRERTYINLLNLYVQEDKSIEIKDLFLQIGEDNESVSSDFMAKLGKYLKSKNVDVPFVVPLQKWEGRQEKFEKPKSNHRSVPKPVFKPAKTMFIEQLEKGNFTKIREAYHQLPEQYLIASIGEISDRKTVALFFLFEALAEDGDVLALEKINSLLSETKQNGIWYENSRAKAYALCGRAQQWIVEWIEKADETKDLKILEKTFPVNGFYTLLERNPHLLAKCEDLAKKYAKKGIMRPMSAIWCYHFIKGENDMAQKLWTNYIQYSDYIFYLPITTNAVQLNDKEMILELINCLKLSDTGKAHMYGAYNALLEIYIRQNCFDDALKVVEAIRTSSGKLARKTLIRLKTGLEQKGKNCPYKIPLPGEKIVPIICNSDTNKTCN